MTGIAIKIGIIMTTPSHNDRIAGCHSYYIWIVRNSGYPRIREVIPIILRLVENYLYPEIEGCYSYYTKISIILCRSRIRGGYSYYVGIGKTFCHPRVGDVILIVPVSG